MKEELGVCDDKSMCFQHGIYKPIDSISF